MVFRQRNSQRFQMDMSAAEMRRPASPNPQSASSSGATPAREPNGSEILVRCLQAVWIGELLVVDHGAIPLAFNALASAWTAREQCVLTLPSEHPITEAVSATSSSSQ